MKKWTIICVNYKTSVYMRWQFKILHEFNNPEDFEIIIVDNSRPSEKEIFDKMIAQYNKKYNTIKIIYHTPKAESASGQHAEGLNIAIKEANSKYTLIHDPDFFFVKPNYLDFLASFLDKGLVAVGAPYIKGVGLGNPNFPAIFGIALPTAIIKDIDCGAKDTKQDLMRSHILFPDRDYSFDSGYQIREKLSTEEDNTNFLSFKGEDEKTFANNIGEHTFEICTQKYSYNDEVIAYHLFRGSFTGAIDNLETRSDPNKEISSHILSIRNELGLCFYGTLRAATDKISK